MGRRNFPDRFQPKAENGLEFEILKRGFWKISVEIASQNDVA
jgi:hypothetical protein